MEIEPQEMEIEPHSIIDAPHYEAKLRELLEEYGPVWIVRTCESRIRQLEAQRTPDRMARAAEYARSRRKAERLRYVEMENKLRKLEKKLQREGNNGANL